MTGALLAIAVPLCGNPEVLDFHCGARAYFESAYVSSSGRLSYTQPVAEQWGYANLSHKDFGWIDTDCWIGSALNNETDSVHRRAFYCYEGTLTYGNKFSFTDDLSIRAWGGLIWDWLGGYKSDVGTQIGWIAELRFENPVLTPYINGLGFFEETTWVRFRMGVCRRFKPCETVAIVPYADAIWGDSSRYRSNFGIDADGQFFGGSLMCSIVGVVVEWSFHQNCYLWGRYRHYLLIDSNARDAVERSDSRTARKDMPVFGLGIGVRF